MVPALEVPIGLLMEKHTAHMDGISILQKMPHRFMTKVQIAWERETRVAGCSEKFHEDGWAASGSCEVLLLSWEEVLGNLKKVSMVLTILARMERRDFHYDVNPRENFP